MGMRDKHRGRGAFGVNLSLIITPMLDMSFQILAFFVMTYHPSALEAQISGSLAMPDPAGPRAKLPPGFVPPVPGLEDIGDAVSVVVKVGDAGKPQKILLKRLAEPTPRQIAGAEVNWQQAKRDLERELRGLRKDMEGDVASIRIEADGELIQQYVMEVYDVCKTAGYGKIAFVPPPASR
jgi:biopolymer transport protein ExbD